MLSLELPSAIPIITIFANAREFQICSWNVRTPHSYSRGLGIWHLGIRISSGGKRAEPAVKGNKFPKGFCL